MARKRTKSKGRKQKDCNSSEEEEEERMITSSMSPSAASDFRNFQKLTHSMPKNSIEKGTQDVRFWRRGFSGENDVDQTFQWSDYGSKAVKVRFRVDQWHSDTMKLLKYIRSMTRSHGTVMRTLPVTLPLLFFILGGYDISIDIFTIKISNCIHISSQTMVDGIPASNEDVTENCAPNDSFSAPISVMFLRRLVTIAVIVVPTYRKKLDFNRMTGIIMALLSIYLSRVIIADSLVFHIPPIIMSFIITSVLVILSFHLEIVAPHAFAGEKVRAFRTDKLDDKHNEIWIEESGLVATLAGNKWDASHHRCEKKLLSTLYPKAGIPDMVTSKIDFAIYKNMSTKALKGLIKSRFWQFKQRPSWPEYVKSSDGTFFPLEAVVLDPERFRVKFEAGAHDEGLEGSDDEITDMDYENSLKLWTKKKERLAIELKKRRNFRNNQLFDDVDDIDEDDGSNAPTPNNNKTNRRKSIRATRSTTSSNSSSSSTRVSELRKSSLFNTDQDEELLDEAKLKRLQDIVSSQKEMFDGSDVWSLPPLQCSDLNYPTTFLRTPRILWKNWQSKILGQIVDWYVLFTSNWFTKTVFVFILVELFGHFSVWSDVQAELQKDVLDYTKKYFAFFWHFVTNPLRHIYQHGPSTSTPFGNIGFWNGKPNLQKCAERSNSDLFGIGFWNSTEELRLKCDQDCMKWEDQFVHGVIVTCILYFLYQKIKP
jgi:hypothetical protein